jgi:hypothetical protein
VRTKKQEAQVAPAMPIVPRLLSVKDAALYLGTTIWQIRTLAWSKQLVPLRLGHRQVFDVQDLDTLVEKLKRGAA